MHYTANRRNFSLSPSEGERAGERGAVSVFLSSIPRAHLRFFQGRTRVGGDELIWATVGLKNSFIFCGTLKSHLAIMRGS